MAPRARPTALEPGDVLAVRLGPRRFGVCQVVWTQPEWGHVSLVVLDGFFDHAPTLAETKKLPILTFRHPHYDGPFWVRILKGKELAPFLTCIGRRPPPSAARAFPLGDRWVDPEQLRRSTTWKAIPATLLREDRHRTDAAYARAVAAWPRPGDVFAFPAEGGFDVCRLLRVAGRIEEDRYAFRWYVACGSVRARKPPTLEAAMRVLAGAGVRAFTTTEPPPAKALLVGHAPQTKAERVRTCDVMASWPAAPATKAKAPSEDVTLETVTARSLFGSWKSKVTAGDRALARRIIARLVAKLRRAKSRADATEALRDAVTAFNATSFIETSEREDLCELLGQLGRSAGLPGRSVDTLVDRARDW